MIRNEYLCRMELKEQFDQAVAESKNLSERPSSPGIEGLRMGQIGEITEPKQLAFRLSGPTVHGQQDTQKQASHGPSGCHPCAS